MKYNIHNKILWMLSIFIAFLIIIPVICVKSGEVYAQRLVKVGYFGFDGYHNTDEDGKRSGYGYDYLQKMSEFTQWKYEYIDGSWSECLEMLENGEIDLITSAQYTEERAEKFDFSKKAIGTSDVILTVRSDNKKYIFGEESTLDGMHIGQLKGNSRNNSLKKYMDENNLTFTSKDFSSEDELTQALKAGEVDAIVTSNLRILDGEKIVAEFAPSPYYVMVKKGNSEFLKEVDYAIEQIGITAPLFEDELYQRYYGANNGGYLAFTDDEKEYIIHNNTPTVTFPPNMKPMVWFEDGECLGIVPDILREAARMSKIQLEFIECTEIEEYERMLKNNECDIYGIFYMDYYLAEIENVRLTKSYMDTSFSIISLLGERCKNEKVAVVDETYFTQNYVEKNYEADLIERYKTTNECIEAVSSGKVKYAVLYSYVAQNIINENTLRRFKVSDIPNSNYHLAAAVNKNSDLLLYSVINKAITSMDYSDINTIINTHTVNQKINYGLVEFFYSHPIETIIGMIILFLILLAVAFIIFRNILQQKTLALANNAARFGAVLCETYEDVSEFNFSDGIRTHLTVEDSRLVKTVEGSSINEIFERTKEKYLHPDDIEGFKAFFSRENILRISQSMQKHVLECRFKFEGQNEYHWNSITLQGMEGSDTKSIMFFRSDIDEVKQIDEKKNRQLREALFEAERANHAKSNFMSKISHEIRTPLNAVIGFLAIAKKSYDNEAKVDDCISKAEYASKHLLSLINDVLDMSAIESGKMKISNESFDFSKLISSVSAMFYNQAKSKNIVFRTAVNGITDEYFMGDQLRINQILLNLLSNAIKFTPDGGSVSLNITQTAKKNDTAYIQFKVSDTGIGMTDEFQSRIFQQFEQQDESIARSFGGTGLGLSITKNLITMMSGAISAESVPNEGTTFTVNLPLKCDFGKKFRPSETTTSFSNIRALIVDDEESSCEYAAYLMSSCGVQCEYALSGKDAVEHFENLQKKENRIYDLCLIDWKMAEIDGIETIKLIRERFKTEIPLIVVTAYDYSGIHDQASELGVTSFLSKPLFQSTVFDMLMNIYGKYNAVDNQQMNVNINYDFSGKKILLADDNDLNLEIATEILQEYGFEVIQAENGKEVLDIFMNSEEGCFDIIILDIQMPVMDGYETAQMIRKSEHPDARLIPIIAMTANAFTEDISAAMSAGMNNHIAKPIDIPLMLKVLNQYV